MSDIDTGEPDTLIEFAEDKVARKVNSIVSELDEMVKMAANAETVDLIENETHAFGQMQTRVTLILSFLAARKPAPFRIVR